MNILARVPCALCRPIAAGIGLVFVMSGAFAADPLNAVQREELRQAIEQARPVPDQAVSPTMQDLVSAFVSASIRRDALEASEDTEALGISIQERHRALVALSFQRPANLTELAAKLTVITELSDDVERWSLRAVAQDAAALAGEVTK